MVFPIRKIKKTDNQAVKELIEYIFAGEFHDSIKAYPGSDLDNIIDSYGGEKDIFFVASDGNKIVGTVAIKEDEPGVALLRRIFVHPEYRNKGLGKALIAKAKGFCQANGYKRIVFRSTDKMSLANLLCMKNGFSEINQVDFQGMKILQFANNL